jgi:hypothetical protein
MPKYTVYFDIFGKKLKAQIEADNKCHAKDIVRNSIEFDRIEATEPNSRPVYPKSKATEKDLADFFNGVFKGFGGTKL